MHVPVQELLRSDSIQWLDTIHAGRALILKGESIIFVLVRHSYGTSMCCIGP